LGSFIGFAAFFILVTVFFLTILWWLWKWRSNNIFYDKAWSASYVIQEIHISVQEFSRYGKPEKVFDSWTALTPTCVKLNVDASWNHYSQRMGGSGVLHDSLSRWLLGYTCNGRATSPLHAELIAFDVGIRHSWSLGYRVIICESDCAELVNLVTLNSNIGRHWLKDIIVNLRTALTWEWEITINHIPRGRNEIADALARHGLQHFSPSRV
jgi:ribonuclease HI